MGNFESSALVVAHPDDEVLWFSSIVGRVSRLVICYEDCADLPELGPGRRRAQPAYPLSNVTWLRRPEPCSHSAVDWRHPVQTPYGMALNAPAAAETSETRYRASFETLRADLQATLRGMLDVFTHNPWGEYGHPDHVQLSRVVKSLRAELGFRLFYSSYIAPRSMAFAAEFLPHLRADRRLATDVPLAARIKAVYEQHDCWTWDEGYVPAPEEAFLVEADVAASEGTSLPLNCVMTV